MPQNPVVILTRAPEDNRILGARLRDNGFDYMDYPCIQTEVTIEPGARSLQKETLKKYQVLIFTSKRAVRALKHARADLNIDRLRLAAVGSKTAEEIRTRFGTSPWLAADPPTGESLARTLIEKCGPGDRLLYLRGNKTTGVLKSLLSQHGLILDEIIVYRHKNPDIKPIQLDAPAIAVLASPSAAECFLKHNSHLKSRITFLAIGPTTAEYLKKRNIFPVYQSKKPETESLYEEIINIHRIHNLQNTFRKGDQMNRTFKKSENLYKRALSLIPGGVNSPVRSFSQVGGKPVYFEKASGSGFTDADGNQYTDYCQSWGPLILGHTHPKVIEAVQKTAESGLSFGACHKGEIAIAELALSAFPGFDRIRFMSSGTEAVMAAVRLARGTTGRDYVVKFAGGYHGHFDSMLVKAGSGLATQAIASSHGIPQTTVKKTLVLPLDDEDTLEAVFNEYKDQIAAVVIEPLPANNGLLVQRKEFLSRLRDITQQNETLLIFDEVISGFRLHFGAYWQMVDIVPDLFTLGKIIGGGMPVGAVVGDKDLMDRFAPLGKVYQAGTLSGNPVALAAGKATLEILKNDPPYAKLDELGKHFTERLSASGHPYARAQQVGSLLWLYLDENEFPRRADAISSQAMDRFTALYGKLLQAGHYLPPSSFEVLFLSAAHSREQVESLAGDLSHFLKEELRA